MSEVSFQIGEPTIPPVPLGAVWVHLQDVTGVFSLPYSIRVPAHLLEPIFDPSNIRDDVSWPSFIETQIADFGTFIVEGYFNNIRRLFRERTTRFAWVIATVDRIDEGREHEISLCGRVVPFQGRG